MALVDTILATNFLPTKDFSRERIKGKKKDGNIKTDYFATLVVENAEAEELESAGLPANLFTMDVERALIFLKDELDSAADKLADNSCVGTFLSFKKAVKNFIYYISHNNFEIVKHDRQGFVIKQGLFTTYTRPRDPLVQIHEIDEKLTRLSVMILQNHAGKIQILTSIGEIKGLIIDFFAA